MGCTIDTVAATPRQDRTQARDNVIEAEGKPILNQAQLLHLLRPKYEGETVSLKVKRGDKTEEYKDIKLAAQQSNVDPGFLGVLLMRDDPEPGAEIRYVYANSGAERAGLKPGDRIMKVGPRVKGGPKPPKIDPKNPMPRRSADGSTCVQRPRSVHGIDAELPSRPGADAGSQKEGREG
jgi:S1-C subfamily serine protease